MSSFEEMQIMLIVLMIIVPLIVELIKATKEGFETAIVFIIQMEDVKCFKPNDLTHKQFGDALRKAVLQGVKVFALDCTVTKDRVTAKNQVEIVL